MIPDTLFAMARISQINRELSDRTMNHRSEAIRQWAQAHRARRGELVARVGRAVGATVRGPRIGRTAAAA